MLILLDVGNTAVTCGLFKSGRLAGFRSAQYINIPKLINKWSKSGDLNNIDVIISSVVPKITLFLKKALKAENTRIWVVGSSLKVPVKHRYKKASSLGIDRIINAYGGLRMYKTPLLIIDFGTAITFDYVSSKKIFEGGMIIPGPELSFQTLCARAAGLPHKARLPVKAKSFLGTSTHDCLSSGILEGYGAMTEGLINRFKARFGKKLKVIATGGFAKTLSRYTRGFDKIDPAHSIKSLRLLYKETFKR